ncbi:MAG: M48 family metalloprotease [Chryseolinea sp.]
MPTFYILIATTNASNAGRAWSRKLFPKTGKLLIALLVILLCGPFAFGQNQDFIPLSLHGPKSVDLMSQIDRHLSAEGLTGRAAKDPWIEHVRLRQATLLKRMVRARAFVNNDTVQRYVEQYFERLASHNKMGSKSRLVLIMNSPESNAACYGSGVFIVTTGLLANMPDEASLAFILAHEMAHDELLHVQQSLRALSREREARNPAATFARILLTDVNEEYIDAFRTTIYASAAMSREHEMQADSLALSLIQHAGYAPVAAGRALSTLASLRQSEPSNLFAAFQFNDFPFKEHWLDERLKIYYRKPTSTFLWSFDSLRSHPQMDQRIKMLEGYEANSDRLPCDAAISANTTDSTMRANISSLMTFQSIEAAYQSSQYDIALYNLLLQLKTHPGHPYLVMRTTRILVDMFHAKNEGDASMLSQFTSNLNNSERLVNNLLFNLSKEEVAELSYHFINNRGNFDVKNPAHYYLLWETCDLTSRDQVKAKVAAAYSKKFGEDIRTFKPD